MESHIVLLVFVNLFLAIVLLFISADDIKNRKQQSNITDKTVCVAVTKDGDLTVIRQPEKVVAIQETATK
ncbi:MAG: hypothetical protein IJ143_08880 [Neisseriaceae bacterium]|nr:hypothetical protein [Neisseriaceae bacterium]